MTGRSTCRWGAALALWATFAAADGLDARLERALEQAGGNRAEIARALADAPADQQRGMRWLIAHMPDDDLPRVGADFLLDHCAGAYEAWTGAPWREAVPEELFFDAILPYASITEPREAWRAVLREHALPLVKEAATPAQAAVLLNQKLFPLLNVRYSTERERHDAGPLQTMRSGLASCSGLSILLINACRAVGVPARYAGIPAWPNTGGNHAWVEIWDHDWQFTGAAEPTGDALNQGWFVERASRTPADHPLHAIYAVTWTDTPVRLPVPGRDGPAAGIRALNVTERYRAFAGPRPENRVPVRFRIRRDGRRVARPLEVTDAAGATVFSGTSRDDRSDLNDHLTAHLAPGASYTAKTAQAGPVVFTVAGEDQIVDLVLDAGTEGP